MTSSLPSRLSWVSAESGDGLPQFSEDDVVNFLVTEAVVEKAAIERVERQKHARDLAQRRQWRKEAEARLRDEAAPLGVG